MEQFFRVLAQYKVDVSQLPPVPASGAKLQAILAVVFSVLGALCVLFVTIGGFRYVASQGDAQAAARAKNTITYALIGLVVSICAVAIVTFVLGRL
jgi:TRAP-type C4-dicarboxylate transport system permease small subunit